MLDFVNRRRELAELDAFSRTGGLLVLFGRRRVGKTRLLRHWLKSREGLYTQAIEATRDQQLEQVFADIRPSLKTSLQPKSWLELFEILDLQPRRQLLCIDEFPYLAAADSSLPSVLQRWLDHREGKGGLILAGSSTRMMNDLFLNRAAPLYGRAQKLIRLEPMGYRAFCDAVRSNPINRETFTRFALVGGVPKYWEAARSSKNALQLAEELYFGTSPYLEFEPARLLKDEGIVGLSPVAVLEAVGRGAEKPSEVAARMNTAQTNLSRVFQLLIDAAILERQQPFGENARSTKRVFYRLADPSTRFWYRVYSPHRSRWSSYSKAEQQKLLDDHASTVFEDCIRAERPGSTRYWEGTLELDVVYPTERSTLEVLEVKWTKLSKAEKAARREALRRRFETSALAPRWQRVKFDVVDQSALATLS